MIKNYVYNQILFNRRFDEDHTYNRDNTIICNRNDKHLLRHSHESSIVETKDSTLLGVLLFCSLAILREHPQENVTVNGINAINTNNPTKQIKPDSTFRASKIS